MTPRVGRTREVSRVPRSAWHPAEHDRDLARVRGYLASLGRGDVGARKPYEPSVVTGVGDGAVGEVWAWVRRWA